MQYLFAILVTLVALLLVYQGAAILHNTRRILMDQAQLVEVLGAAVDQLTTVSDGLTGVGDQLTKATAEIVAEIANGNVTSPAVDAAVTKLQAVATALADTGAKLKVASQALDDLNVDTPPPAP